MNYHGITQTSVIDGLGVRVVLWLSGCNHKCQGCHNPETWDCNSGKPFTQETYETLMSYLKYSYIKGLTLSGGDPLHENNLNGVMDLIYNVRKYFPEKDIWLYSGYTWEEIQKESNALRRQIVENTDFFVDGRFKKDQRNITLAFRGSNNQRIIDIKETLKTKGVKLLNVK